jgi:hypothetical protein
MAKPRSTVGTSQSLATGQADERFTESAGEKTRRPARKTLIVAIVFISLAYAAGLFYYASVRPIEGDEGYYSTAARLVAEGQAPYRDFSYQQGVLLPYLYSWIWLVHPRSLVAMRFFSAACGAIAVLLWGLWLSSWKRPTAKIALFTFGAILVNPNWISKHVVVESFAVADLLASLAMICLYAAIQSGRLRWYFMVGLSLGLCVAVRSLYCGLIPLLLVCFVYLETRDLSAGFPKTLALLAGAVERGGKVRTTVLPFPRTLAYLAGAACGLLPVLYSLTADPGAFLFNNVRGRQILQPYPGIRQMLHMYWQVARSLAHQGYFPVEMLLAAIGAISLWRLRGKSGSLYTSKDYIYCTLAILMFAVYSATALVPYPVFNQYFTSPLIPFLVCFMAEGLRITLNRTGKAASVLLIVIPVLFLHGLRGEILLYSGSPQNQLAFYRKVARAIEAGSRPDAVVISLWPGFLLDSGRRYYPGSDDHFNYVLADRISAPERRRYHLISTEDVVNAVSGGKVDMFLSAPYRTLLESSMSPREAIAFKSGLDTHYRLVNRFDGVKIYRKR